MTAADEPVVELAKKRLRHDLEETLRALPLEQRFQRVLTMIVQPGSGGSVAGEMQVRMRYMPNDSTPDFQITAYGNGGQWRDTVGEALVDIGADKLERLEEEAENLRKQLATVEARLASVQGSTSAVTTARAESEDIPF